MSKTVDDTVRPYRALRFGGGSNDATRILGRRSLGREGRSPARSGSHERSPARTRSELPVSREHRLPVALPARGYNPFTSPTLLHLRPFLPLNNYINDDRDNNG